MSTCQVKRVGEFETLHWSTEIREALNNFFFLNKETMKGLRNNKDYKQALGASLPAHNHDITHPCRAVNEGHPVLIQGHNQGYRVCQI